ISGMQGSTSTLADGKVVQGYLWDYGDGKTAQTTQLSHSYDAPGRYVTTLQLYNYLDQTGITLTGNPMYVGPFVEDISADKAAGGLGDTFNISVVARNVTSIDWYLARFADGQWYSITGAHGDTLSYTPNQYGDWYFRAKATNSQTGYSVTTETVKITIYRPPVITNTQITPEKGPLTQTITLSASVQSAGTPTLQWQRSTDGSVWTNIDGATTSAWVGTQTLSAGKYYYRLAATGLGGTSYSNPVSYTAYGAPAFTAQASASASVVALPGSVVLSASASDTNTYTWQELLSGNWVNIGTGAKLTERIQSAGVHTYRVLASGYGGQTYSNTITVDAGYVPQVSITNPPNAQKFNMGTTVIFTASISGADTFTWDFGTGANIISLGTTSQVNYTEYGYKTVKVTATNKYGSETAGITIYIVNGDRPLATDRFDPIDTGAVDSFVNQFDVAPGTMPNPVDIIMSLFDPLDNAFKGFFWVLVFGAIMIVIWLITKSIAIPSVLGILFGAFMVGFMPDMYIMPAAALIAAGCIGGIIYVITKHN
ncbi:PKD domain-containing protein, partial [Methanocorpusculum sp.]|nr:PKD domain-containing protein [Methanocorpusculum sp.]